jgi:hypothetical protein
MVAALMAEPPWLLGDDVLATTYCICLMLIEVEGAAAPPVLLYLAWVFTLCEGGLC